MRRLSGRSIRRIVGGALVVVAAAAAAGRLDGGGHVVAEVGVIRATANPTAVTDAQGRRWSSRMTSANGTEWSGGRIACSAGTVYGTAAQDLYRCTLLGVRHVTVPLPSGTYAVTLSFAETLGAGPHSRVFDVQADGRTVASAVDVAAAAGPQQAYHALFTTPVTSGRLDLRFRARVGEPILSALEVTRLGPAATAPRVVWSDEFSGPQGSPPDPRDWTYDTGGGGWGNHELQRYTRSPANAALDGRGDLAIAALRDPGAEQGGYTSARLKTEGRFAFRYGRLDARIKVPAGRGLLPAFWATGESLPRVGWPDSGEFDAMEVVGSRPTVVHGSAHGPQVGADPYMLGGATRSSEPLDRRFHVYGVLWLPGALQFQLDGRPYATVVQADFPSDHKWVFDRPFSLLLNVAVGGDWPGSPDATTHFPASMLVDWVRVTR